MLNPLDIEQQYQNLLLALSKPSVSWQRVSLIIDFLDALLVDASRTESYVLDALDLLYPLLRIAEPTSRSPEEVRRPLDILRRIGESLPQVMDDDRYAAARDHLRTALCRTWLCVGDVRALLGTLDDRYAAIPPPWIEEVSEEVLRDHCAVLQVLASRIPHPEPFAARCLKALLATCRESSTGDAEMVRVPVVERGFGDVPPEPHSMLRKVTLRITGPGGPEGDRIETAIAVYGAETIGHSIVEAPVAAARRLLDATPSRLKRRTVSGIVTLDQHPALHEGDSAGLGIAALLYAAALRATNQRLIYRISPDVAMTGVIDPEGNVGPVDSMSLVPKTRAVFFSDVQTMVLPREQLAVAEAEVQQLRTRYPHRRLDVVGVSHLREVFFDRRIIRQYVIPRSLHLLRATWRHRAVLASATLIVALLATLVSTMLKPLDRNPVSTAYVGELLILKNATDDTLATLRVGPSTVAHASAINRTRGFSTSVCFDVDGDGTNDVIYVEKAWNATGGIDLLRCWSAARRAFLWTAQQTQSYRFPAKPEAEGTNYMLNGMVLNDSNNDGRRELVVSANHSPSFPGVLTRFDPATGSVLGEYLHVGNIMDFRAVDINDDGINEIVGCGVNNAFNSAALFCLDGRGFAGYSPAASAYQPAGVQPARERTYLLIPRTIIGETFRAVRDNNAALSVSVMHTNREITVSVDDGCGTGPAAVLNFTFDFDFHARHIAQGDSYDALAEDLVRRGALAAVPDLRYFEHLQRKLRYWDGSGWSAGPRREAHRNGRNGRSS